MGTFATTTRTRAASWTTLVRRVFLSTIAAVVVTVGIVIPTSIAPAQAGTSTRTLESSFDAQVLHYTNVERQKRGLRKLTALTCPDRFAQSHTQRLASRDRFYHQKLRPVLRQCGLRTAGENLAWRSPSITAQQVVRMWMNSPGHRANILRKKYRYLGVDAFRSDRSGRVYVGQVFGG